MWLRYPTLNMVQSLKGGSPEIGQEKKKDIDYFSRNMNCKYLTACFKLGLKRESMNCSSFYLDEPGYI